MRTTLLAFHGFTLNGTHMQAQLGGIEGKLAVDVDLVCPDAPHECSPESVERFYAASRTPRPAPPHLCGWDATDDGAIYNGWERTRDAVHELIDRHAPVGLLGFSQGAMLAASIAALSSSKRLPSVRFAVIVAGRVPRASILQSLFDRPIQVPSLHVWGDADKLTGAAAPALVEHFDPAVREVVRWPGPHVIPTRGAAADSIVSFVRRHG
jgi:predicted esterase